MPKDSRPSTSPDLSTPLPRSLAHPKHPPLCGGELVRFRLFAGGALRPGYVIAPEGAEITAEIEGDEVLIRPPHSARIFTVDRRLVKKLSGKKMMEMQERLARPVRRPSVIRGKAQRGRAAVFILSLLTRPDAAPPAAVHVVHAGPAPLRAVPKPAPPPRSEPYKTWVQGLACIGCPSQTTPTEAHHHGRRAVGRKCSDYRCVPLCQVCHDLITSTHRLPGRTRRETEDLIAAAQLDLHDAWLSGAAADGQFIQGTPAPAYSAADPAFLSLLDDLHHHLQGVPHVA